MNLLPSACSPERHTRSKLGIHAAVFARPWAPAEAERAARGASRAGFEILEIPVLVPESVDSASTRELLEQHGLEPVCSLGLDESSDIAGPDPEAAARGEDLLLRALEKAHELGSPLLTGVTYGVLGRHAGPPTAHGRAAAQRVVARLAAAAADKRMRVGVEVVNRYESNLLNTAEQGIAFIDEIGADNLVLHLDTYHMNIEESDFSIPVLAAGERLGYVHVGESHRGYLGTGTIDFTAFFRALDQAGYRGAITFESFSPGLAGEHLSCRLAIWRETWRDADDLARHAHRYLADLLDSAYASSTDSE